MKFLVLALTALTLSAQARTDFSKPFRNLFMSQDAEIIRGTEQAIKMAEQSGRRTIVVFPTKTIQYSDGSSAAAAVVVEPNDPQTTEQKKDEKFLLVTGLSLEATVGGDFPSEDLGDSTASATLVEKVGVRLFNNRAMVYAGVDWGADAKDRMLYGARLNVVHGDSYYSKEEGSDLYLYAETNPGNPVTEANAEKAKINLRYSTGIGYLWNSANGAGVVFEGGIAFYEKPGSQDEARGLRISAGFVKQWGKKARKER